MLQSMESQRVGYNLVTINNNNNTLIPALAIGSSSSCPLCPFDASTSLCGFWFWFCVINSIYLFSGTSRCSRFIM